MNLIEFKEFYKRLSEEKGYIDYIKEYPPAHIAHKSIEPLLKLSDCVREMIDLWYATGEVNREVITSIDILLSGMEHFKLLDNEKNDKRL